MSHLDDCLAALPDKKGTKKFATDQLEQLRIKFGGEASDDLLKEELARIVAEEKAARARIRKFTEARAIALDKRLEASPNPGQGLVGIREPLRSGAGQKHVSVRQAIDRWQTTFSRMLGDKLDAITPKISQLYQRQPLSREIVRELYGENTGNALAKEIAEVLREAFESGRKAFNDLGGAIADLEIWRLPQRHDRQRIVGDGSVTARDKWIDHIQSKLDWRAMREQNPNMPLDNERAVLADVWESIRTGGLAFQDITLNTTGVGSGPLGLSRSDHRILYFKDATSWLEYQEAFGVEIHDAILGHFRNLSRDLGRMEILGPDPSKTANYIENRARQRAAELGGKAAAQFDGYAAEARRMDLTQAGTLDIPESELLANSIQTMRNSLVASQLGSAVLTAISDYGFMTATNAWNGLPATRWGIMPILENIARTPAGKARMREARELGAYMQHMSAASIQEARFWTGSHGLGAKWSRLAADAIMTLSGLNADTRAKQAVWQLSLLQDLGKDIGTDFGDLKPARQRILEGYGISAEDWAQLEPTHLRTSEVDGLKRLDVFSVMQDNIDLGQRLHGMMTQEVRSAIPVISDRSRGFITQGHASGTFMGEFMRSATFFRGFAAESFAIQVGRMMSPVHPGKFRARYLANVMIATTMFGAVAYQMRQVSQGRDPAPMNTGKFWASAILMGGGLGLFSDLLFTDVNRYGGGLTETAAGPMGQMIDDLFRLTLGNTRQLIEGNETKFVTEAARFLRRNTPGQNLWYTRLAMDRLVFDALVRATDPEAATTFKQQRRYWERQHDQESFWRPGETTPRRAPDIGAVVQ